MISVVFSAKNEINNHFFWQSLEVLRDFSDWQIIVVIGSDCHATIQRLNRYPVHVITSESEIRAIRQNQGIAIATFPTVLLWHPRSIIDRKGLIALTKLQGPVWGAFTHQFDWKHPLLQFTSWYSNHIRGDHNHIFYLDHCIFFSKELVVGPEYVPEVDIFEDTLLCHKLRKKQTAIRLPQIATTSAIRFKKNGPIYQALLNQFLKLGFYFNIPKRWMNRIYEMGLNLNSKY